MTHLYHSPFGTGRSFRRIAGSLVSALFASAILAACDAGTTSPDADAASAVELSASLLQLSTGDTARITIAQGTWQRATWISEEPRIAAVDDAGLVAARQPGETVIRVSTAKGQASARVRVGKRSNRVTIAPATSTLAAPGDSVRLVATVVSSAGDTIDASGVTWASLNAAIVTIDAHGTVVGRAAGIARVVATLKDDADTATVTVQAKAAPAPGPAAECDVPRTAWIWCDDFEQDRMRSYFEHNDHGGDFVRAASVGRDGSSGMRARWQQAGQVSAGWMHVAFGRTPGSRFVPVDAGTRNYREIYWRFYIRNQPGWTGGGGHKISRAKIFAASDYSEAMQALVWSSYSQPDYLVLDPVSYTDAAGTLTGTARWLGSRRGPTPIFDAAHVGQWHCIEARVRLNDAGQSNGVFHLWLDGTTEVSRTDLNWVGAYDAYGINTVSLDNYWNDGVPQAQERYLDNLVVSTERIGC